VADVPGEAGLWYRLAPITFLGGSLLRGGQGHDPCEPAALGSAILTGPDTGATGESFQRFLAAGAARTAGSAEALGEAVADLLAPDRAAEMARRAWEITSAGSDLTDRVIELVTQSLDERDGA
jgi:3-deoxy-D-manno-octulosonic-acid transferase